MEARFLQNSDEQLLTALRARMQESSEVFFTSAFGSLNGFQLISKEFSKLMKNAGAAKFCFDITQGMTSPDLIEELYTYPGECSVRICIRNEDRAFLHSKIYLFETEDNFSAIIGSSNFSHGGLQKNIEARRKLQAEAPVQKEMCTVWAHTIGF